MQSDIKKMIDEKVEEFRKQLIEEAKKLVEKEDVFPKVGDTYWFINSHGQIIETHWENSNLDKGRLSIGNVFKTEEEAEFALEKLKVIAELKKFAEPKDRAWDASTVYHYYIYWDYIEAEIFIARNSILKHNGIYFESEEKAFEAMEAVGRDRIRRYYLEVEE